MAVAVALSLMLAAPSAAAADEVAAVVAETLPAPQAVTATGNPDATSALDVAAAGAAAGATSGASAEAVDELTDDGADVPEDVQAILDAAQQHIGTPYRWGGTGPKRGFDCSGLVNYVYRQTINVVLPRAARDLARLGTVVKQIIDLRPGDLVFFNTRGRKYSHVGIYLGGSSFIHAPRRGTFVRIDDITDPYFTKRFNGGRRLDLIELMTRFPDTES